MRLIDADELKTAFPACDNSKPVLIASVRATINHMPTIEPMRKKGKWIRKPSPDKYHCGYVICPYCKGEYVESDGDIFCPICGSYNG